MDWEQMRRRCPGSKSLGAALLPNHRLAFTRFSRFRQCGVADVIPEPGGRVWGRLYELTASDLQNLDKREGAARTNQPNDYDRVTKTVDHEGDPHLPLDVQVYVVPVLARAAHLPSQAYMNLILSGARDARLPSDYIQWLMDLPVS